MAEPFARPRYVTAGALATATVVAIVVAIVVMRSPDRPTQPLRNAEAAADCGVTDSVSCIVEAPPCSGAECALLLVPQ
jgi:hypothetical protein